ncbi:MAG: ribulose-phosphate 3-epimerase [Defluviitaleaceae bacterium]|nr:ribulose-phosphate 3-epimerase [Defluviitaleaceae bacterium]
MIINAPSLANCSFLNMGEQVAQLVKGGADWFHVDIMDGHYVPNLCFPLGLIKELKNVYPQIPVDVHIMVENPASYVQRLAELKVDYLSFHLDATRFARRLLSDIKNANMKAGVVINPSQPIDLLEPVIDMVDYVVLMTVEPGYAGQKFMVEALPRLARLVEMRKANGNPFLISIDGGVDMENAKKCVQLGAEVYVTGIFTVFNQPEGLEAACRKFKETVYNI